MQVTVGAITVTAQATSSPDRHDKQGSGDFYLAISGDLQLATSGDFYMPRTFAFAGSCSRDVRAKKEDGATISGRPRRYCGVIRASSAETEVRQLTASQRSTIRRGIRNALVGQPEGQTLQEVCKCFPNRFGLSRAALRHLMGGELALPAPERLTTSQKSRLRRDIRRAKAITDTSARDRAIDKVCRRYQALPTPAFSRALPDQ